MPTEKEDQAKLEQLSAEQFFMPCFLITDFLMIKLIFTYWTQSVFQENVKKKLPST